MRYLSAEKISFSYGNKKILDEVSVSFPSGSFTCLIGPNGAGKTTLLRLLGGLIKPSGGIVSYDNCDVNTAKKNLPISYLPHKPDVIFPFTAYETVSMGVRKSIVSFGFDIDENIVFDAMKNADCLQFRNRIITELSAGELQRVFIAQAIISNPEILLLDEPTSALDLCHQLELMKKLRSWADMGKTIIAVIHDVNLAAFYADRLCLVKDGKIIADGNVNKVFTENNMNALYNTNVAIHTNNGMKYWLPIQ